LRFGSHGDEDVCSECSNISYKRRPIAGNNRAEGFLFLLQHGQRLDPPFIMAQQLFSARRATTSHRLLNLDNYWRRLPYVIYSESLSARDEPAHRAE
jgi:hypothetical protein